MRKNILRVVTEMGFILFLFYANLLMGEFTNSGIGQEKGLAWAIFNIFTWYNLIIGIAAALVGYIVFEYLRKQL